MEFTTPFEIVIPAEKEAAAENDSAHLSRDPEDEEEAAGDATNFPAKTAAAASSSADASSSSINASFDGTINNNKKRKRHSTSLLKNAMEELDRIWNNGGSNTTAIPVLDGIDDDVQETMPVLTSDAERIKKTTNLLTKILCQGIHEPAIRALVANEELEAKQIELKDELETKEKEIDRLERSEQRNRESIQNLLKAINTSTEDIKDHSRSQLLEANMRADLLHARSERDASQKDALVAERSVALLQQGIDSLRQSVQKLKTEKLCLERELRSARSLADGLSSSLLTANGGNSTATSDLDFYKSKTKELEIHLQGMTAKLADKNKEIQELRRYDNRNWSQHRLEALRVGQEPRSSPICP